MILEPIYLRRYDAVLLERVKEMAEGIVVKDAPVFKTKDELMKQHQVSNLAIFLRIFSEIH